MLPSTIPWAWQCATAETICPNVASISGSGRGARARRASEYRSPNIGLKNRNPAAVSAEVPGSWQPISVGRFRCGAARSVISTRPSFARKSAYLSE